MIQWIKKIWQRVANISFDELIEDQGRWADETFPNGTAIGVLIHAHKEVDEIIQDIENKAEPEVLSKEYADAIFCIMNSARRKDISLGQIIDAGNKKLQINKGRKWKDNGDGSYSHVKEDIPEEEISAPVDIKILAKGIKVLEWRGNLAKGELKKFKFTESCKNKHEYNDQVVGMESENGDDYDCIWRHVKNDWFKLVGKSTSRTC